MEGAVCTQMKLCQIFPQLSLRDCVPLSCDCGRVLGQCMSQRRDCGRVISML